MTCAVCDYYTLAKNKSDFCVILCQKPAVKHRRDIPDFPQTAYTLLHCTGRPNCRLCNGLQPISYSRAKIPSRHVLTRYYFLQQSRTEGAVVSLRLSAEE